MSKITPIVMFGAMGRMGRMILELAVREPQKYQIIGAVEYEGHPCMGQSLASVVPGCPQDVTVQPQPPASVPAGTVAIHFSLPEGTMAHLEWSRQNKVATLVGTTGLDAQQSQQILALASDAPVMLTPNTSLGVNVLFWLAEKAATLLDDSYDIEIFEMHHNQKKDAPSGTAQGLLEVVKKARGVDDDVIVHGRHGLVGARPRGEIGMHTLRGGDVVGDHTVVLAGPGERIELKHQAHTRAIFANGALRGASWLSLQAPGSYSMKDVLGLQ